jgi:hypothetical protein
MNRLTRRLGTVATAAVMATPALAIPATTASASVPAISAQAFGMHWLGHGGYPKMPFSSARIWGGNAPTWAQLQPSGPTPVYSAPDVLGNTTQTGWNPAAWDQNALNQLDAIVNAFVSHHVDPMITLGMTPGWAADTSSCAHVDSSGHDWGTETCPPVTQAADGTDPWSAYVTFLANRYSGKVHYFELWNEPSLRNGYNGNVTRLAQMQNQAYGILHSYGDKLVSPSIPFTNGSPRNPAGPGVAWLKSFLSQPGGKSFDITGLHLYPSDGAVKGRIGPEWAVNGALYAARKVLSSYGIGGRQIWNTEMNVGRIPAGTNVGGGIEGAADVARTFILSTQSHIARTLWYAADDRSWGGVQLEGTNYSSLTTAGYAERTVRNLLVGKAPLGCARTTIAANKWKYTCKFGTTTGHKTLLAVWTTGANYALRAPAGIRYFYTVTGARHPAYKGKKFTISHTPVYFYGSFK